MYNWAPHQEECRRIFLDENKSIAELQKYLSDRYGFEPSKRAFEFQLRRWGYIKHARVRHPEQLVERIKRLWEQSLSRREILRIVHDEGYQCTEGQIMRLRQKNGWMFRGGNGYTEKEGPRSNSKKRQSDATGASQNSGDEEGHSGPNSGRPNYQAPSNPTASVHTPQRLLRRQEMQARSDQLLATRKRRRRIKGHAGMGPDPPGPPRFPSETTLDESKAFLHLTNAHYQGVRAQFQAMCEETGVTRKAATPPEQWTAIKARLVNEHEHLHREFYGAWNGVPQEQKELALDAICMSVTKLMRTAGKHITIAEAKRILNLNPNDARVIRNEFYEVLRRDHFISKYECGEEHWNELKALWEASSSIVGQSLGAGSDAQKRKAVDRLASDVMKRYRDDLTKADPSLKGTRAHGPGPGPVYKGAVKEMPIDKGDNSVDVGTSQRQKPPTAIRHSEVQEHTDTEDEGSNGSPAPIPCPTTTPYEQHISEVMHGEQPPMQARNQQQMTRFPRQSGQHPPTPRQTSGAQIHQNASNEPQNLQDHIQQPITLHTQTATIPAQQTNEQAAANIVPTRSDAPTATLFRLHPSCPVYGHSSTVMWFGMLLTRSLSEVVTKAMSQHSGVEGRAISLRSVEGILTDEQGQEAGFSIQTDGELDAYFGWMQGGRCIFVVWLDSTVG